MSISPDINADDLYQYELEKQKYWGQFSEDEKNLLQAIYYVGRDINTYGNPEGDDLYENIHDLGIGKNGQWNITGVQPEVLLSYLEKGLKYFR